MVDLSASTIILEYVCPGVGVLICQFMFSAPYRDLRRAVDEGQIGDLNPTPWAFMLGNCFGWVVYGILTQNLFIFWANAPGFLLSVYLNLGAVKLLYQRHHATEMRKSLVAFLQQDQESKTQQPFMMEESSLSRQHQDESETIAEAETETARIYQTATPVVVCSDYKSKTATPSNNNEWATIVWNVTSQTTPAPAPHENLVLGIVTIWTICMSLLGFAKSLELQTQERIVGSLVNLNLVFFYGAPLSTIYTVLSRGNSSSIHIRTMVTNTLNGTFWTAYGIAVLDPIVYVPNGLGAVLGVIQIVLIVVYPRRPASLIHEEEGIVVKGGGEDVNVQETMTLPSTQKTASGLGLMDAEVAYDDSLEESPAPAVPDEEGVPHMGSTDGSSSAEVDKAPPLDP